MPRAAPIVGLTMRVIHAVEYDEPRDSISHDWIRSLVAWGATPALIPNALANVPQYLKFLAPDLLVLTGGDDLGATPLRDATETAVLEYACANGIPVLGVCRGLQFMNVHFGGRLVPVAGHVARPHPVNFASSWRAFYGETASVNSFHETGIRKDCLAPGLTATAHDEAGAVEGVVHESLPLAGVMWHPERQGAPEGDRALIDSLVAASRGRM